MGVVLFLLVLLSLPLTASAQSACTHWASPSGNGNGLSQSSPFQISDFRALGQSTMRGKVLCLLDGTYPGQLLDEDGTSSQPITLRALTPGGALLNGDAGPALWLAGDYWIIQDINIKNGGDNCTLCFRGNNNLVQRVVVWNDRTDHDQDSTINIAGANNTLEDCGVWGVGRKTLDLGAAGAGQGGGNTARRCWAQFERRVNPASPMLPCEIGYAQDDITFENNLCTFDITQYVGFVDSPITIFRTQRSKILGSIAYQTATSNAASGVLVISYADTGYQSGDSPHPVKDNELRHVVGVMSPNHPDFNSYFSIGLNNIEQNGDFPNTVENIVGLTGVNNGLPQCGTSWVDCANQVRGAPTRQQFASTYGQTVWEAVPGICRRYVNGTLTSQPLWPWPMNQRIKDARQSANRSVIDVQAQLEASDMLGPLPAACLTGQQQPVATSLRFDPQPTETPVDTPMAQAVVVKVDDQFGQEFDTFTGTITLTFTPGTDTEAATMSGPGCSGVGSASTCSVQAVQGDATFTSLQFSEPSVDGYRLRATATLNGQVTTVDSATFTVTQPDTAPAQLAWLLAPASALVNAVLTPAPQAQVQTSTGDPYTAGPIPLTIRALPAAQRLSISGRHFVDPQGRAVLLTGSHTWENLIDFSTNPNTPYQWLATLRRMELGWDAGGLGAYQPRQNHVRLWVWEGLSAGGAAQPPYIFLKDGPGGDWDFSTTGCKNPLLVSDAIRFDQDYFDRVATRVGQARERGIYVTVMLFQGWDTYNHGYDPEPYAWYNVANNCNGVNGYEAGTPSGIQIHSLDDPVIVHIQEEYIKKMVDTLYDYDNVLYEISNESHANSEAWQEAMVTFLKNYETSKGGIRHLVGISSFADVGGDLESTNADWIAPGALDSNAPALAATTKPSMWDTDHMLNMDSSSPFTLWAAFVRGHHPIYMDGHPEPIWADPTEDNQRHAMAQIWTVAQRVNLLTLTPQNGGTTPANTGYALHNSTSTPYQYVVMQPSGSTRNVTITGIPTGTYTRQWLNLDTGTLTTQANLTNPASPLTIQTPAANTYGWVLLLRQTTSLPELVLAGTTTQNTSGGSASFPGLTLPRTGVAHLVTTSPGLTTSTSTALTITADTPAATALTLVAPVPTTAQEAVALTPALVVQVVDQGQVPFIPSPAIPITITKTGGPGTCSNLGPVNTDGAGRATFATIACTTAGTVTLRADSAGLTSSSIASVLITGAPAVATKLAFRQQPLSTYLDTVLMPAVTVEIQDANNQFMSTGSATVAVALTTPAGAVLGGDLSNATSSGVATFNDLQINKPGTYTLTATGGGLTAAVSSSFTISAAPPPTFTLHWAMGEGSGTTLNDTGVTGLHDGAFGAGATAPAWVTGPLGGTTALAFTAAQNDIVTNTTITWNIRNPVTVVAWVRTVGAGGANQGLFVGSNDNEESFAIGARLRNTTDQLVWQYGQPMVGGQLTWTWSTALLGTWTRIALVGGGTQENAQRIYVNGTRVASNTYAVTTVDQGNRTGFRLGKHNPSGTNEWCNCEIADLQIHAVAWQDAQAQADYGTTPPPAGVGGVSSMFLGGRP